MAAPTLTTQTLLDDSKRTVIKVVIPNGGDTDAADVKIVDVSELSGAPSAVSIEKIEFSLYNMAINLEWDATADVSSMVLSGTGSFDSTSSFTLDGTSIGNSPISITNNKLDKSTATLVVTATGDTTMVGVFAFFSMISLLGYVLLKKKEA